MDIFIFQTVPAGKAHEKPYFLQRYDYKQVSGTRPSGQGVPGYAKMKPALRKEKLYYAAYNTSHNTHCIRNPAVCLCNAVLCRKKIKEGFLLGWCLFALFFILAGIIPALSFCTGTFAVFSGPAQMILSAFLVLFLFKISEYVSVLSRKNQELAMQVSLLNQENERILTELQQLTGKNKTEL